MSFVVPASAANQPDAPIKSIPFWPDVEPEKVREIQRIDNTITPIRLRATLVEAIASVNDQLKAWRLARVAEGVAKLADIDVDKVDGISVLVNRYQRAVGCTAKALLLERYRDFDSTARGDKNADALTDPIDDLRRDARWAIADILGIGRSVVELI